MMENIQKWVKGQGFAVVKRQGGNKWASQAMATIGITRSIVLKELLVMLKDLGFDLLQREN